MANEAVPSAKKTDVPEVDEIKGLARKLEADIKAEELRERQKIISQLKNRNALVAEAHKLNPQLKTAREVLKKFEEHAKSGRKLPSDFGAQFATVLQIANDAEGLMQTINERIAEIEEDRSNVKTGVFTRSAEAAETVEPVTTQEKVRDELQGEALAEYAPIKRAETFKEVSEMKKDEMIKLGLLIDEAAAAVREVEAITYSVEELDEMLNAVRQAEDKISKALERAAAVLDKKYRSDDYKLAGAMHFAWSKGVSEFRKFLEEKKEALKSEWFKGKQKRAVNSILEECGGDFIAAENGRTNYGRAQVKREGNIDKAREKAIAKLTELDRMAQRAEERIEEFIRSKGFKVQKESAGTFEVAWNTDVRWEARRELYERMRTDRQTSVLNGLQHSMDKKK